LSVASYCPVNPAPCQDDAGLEALIRNGLTLADQLCRGDVMTEVMATYVFVRTQLKLYKIPK
jgi:hypothetical protein